MKLKYVAALAAAIALTGCVSAPEIKSTFNPSEAAFINKIGNGTIKGQAFLRRNDGMVVYAAGSDVRLVPKSAYADERINAIYRGGKIGGYVQPVNNNQQYISMTKVTRANGEGRFEFKNLADGEYYVVTPVSWMAGNMPQGGSLMERATIRGGNTVELVMTGQ